MPEQDYAAHAVKQDPNGTGCVAVCTGLDGERAWRVFRLDGASHLVAYQDIEHWVDKT